MIKFIPNSLTVLRMLLVPVFIWLLIGFEPVSTGVIIGLAVFVIASISDYFDGLLARKYKAISNFGKIMDPLADKLLVLSAMAILTFFFFKCIDIWVFAVVLFREVAVTVLRNYYAKKQIYIPANIWGKLKTVFQMIGIITALFLVSLVHNFEQVHQYSAIIQTILRYYFWFVALVTFLSGLNYFTGAKNAK